MSKQEIKWKKKEDYKNFKSGVLPKSKQGDVTL